MSLDSLKIFLFDNGLSMLKSEQTPEKIHNMVIYLIENNNIDLPKNIRKWYDEHRNFDINVENMDILDEITSHMKLKSLENFCKSNKKYQQYCGKLLSIKLLQEYGMYLLEEPTTYQEWIDIYNRSKIAVYKTDRILSLLNFEKDYDNTDPWLYLIVDDENTTTFNLAENYGNYLKTKIKKYNKFDFEQFSIILNTDTNNLYYKYMFDDDYYKELSVRVNIYDTLYRYFYYYDVGLFDIDELSFDEKELEKELNELTIHDIKEKALRRLTYLKNYQ